MKTTIDTALIENTLNLIDHAIKQIHEEWPLTDDNEWAGPPPPVPVCNALQDLTTAIGHLLNLKDTLA
jgi:hypothetical protein